MTQTQIFLILILLSISVMITRFLPFFVFGRKGQTPKVIDYLGKVLPAAMMGLLVIYCFKDYDFPQKLQDLLSIQFIQSDFFAGCVAGIATALIHLIKRNTILSIVLGTVLYMILINFCPNWLCWV